MTEPVVDDEELPQYAAVQSITRNVPEIRLRCRLPKDLEVMLPVRMEGKENG